MDADFISELDKTLSNVGTDLYWKKTIGGLELWISPLSVEGQDKVTSAMGRADVGLNIVAESKRVTLANAIVGVGETDLREFRGGTPIFPTKGRDGKAVKVPLEQYLYTKMARWGAQFVDDAFEVYADLMETFQKQNLKDITFENAKDPRVELIELEKKVSNLRTQLGLPQLVEEGIDPESDKDLTDEETASVLKAEEQFERESAEEPTPPQGDFDPFKPIEKSSSPPATPPAPVAPPPSQTPWTPPPSAHPKPSMSMPAVLPKSMTNRIPPGFQPQESSPEHPLAATPSVPNEVIEIKQSGRPSQPLPVIDRKEVNKNPRFQPRR